MAFLSTPGNDWKTNKPCRNRQQTKKRSLYEFKKKSYHSTTVRHVAPDFPEGPQQGRNFHVNNTQTVFWRNKVVSEMFRHRFQVSPLTSKYTTQNVSTISHLNMEKRYFPKCRLEKYISHNVQYI